MVSGRAGAWRRAVETTSVVSIMWNGGGGWWKMVKVGGGRRRSIEAAARHFDAAVALDPARAVPPRGGQTTRQTHHDGSAYRAPQPVGRHTRHTPRDKGH